MKNKTRRFWVMCIGIVILGLGICLFKLTLMGNDPSSALVLAICGRIGIDFPVVLIVMNSIYAVIEFLFGRKYIGIGTFVNWFGVGIIASAFEKIITGIWIIPDELLPRIIIMLAGILVLSLASSMYQTANLGISPYDCLSIVLADRLPIPYFWCRIFTDSACSLIACLLGGIVGAGTLVCALGLGPFIQFFNVHVSRKLCGE